MGIKLRLLNAQVIIRNLRNMQGNLKFKSCYSTDFSTVMLIKVHKYLAVCVVRIRSTHNQRAPAWPEGRPQAPVITEVTSAHGGAKEDGAGVSDSDRTGPAC